MTGIARQLLTFPGVVAVDCDFCQYGMQIVDYEVIGRIKKRTRVMTNSTKLACRLMKAQCQGDSKHIPLSNFSAKPCQDYPVAFCDKMCLAAKEEVLSREKGEDSNMTCNILKVVTQSQGNKGKTNIHPHDDADGHLHQYHGQEFYDDVHGAPLEKDRAIAARKLEMGCFKKLQVYSKVDRVVAKQLGGQGHHYKMD